MSVPSAGEITAAISDLRADAKAWAARSEEVAAVSMSLQGLALEAPVFSFAGEQVGLPEAYRNAQTKVAERLAEGVTNMAEVGTALNTAANQYEADEAAGVHRMTGIY